MFIHPILQRCEADLLQQAPDLTGCSLQLTGQKSRSRWITIYPLLCQMLHLAEHVYPVQSRDISLIVSFWLTVQLGRSCLFTNKFWPAGQKKKFCQNILTVKIGRGWKPHNERYMWRASLKIWKMDFKIFIDFCHKNLGFILPMLACSILVLPTRSSSVCGWVCVSVDVWASARVYLKPSFTVLNWRYRDNIVTSESVFSFGCRRRVDMEMVCMRTRSV